MAKRRVFGWVAGLVCVMSAIATAAEPAATSQPAGSKFLRWSGDAMSGKLEAAIVTYRDGQGRRVDLVSAVHVGDKAYFEILDKLFKGYDAVLYEMVKPVDMEPPGPGEKSGSGVSGLQRFIKDMLGLEFQLDAINYRAKNFVHADLDAETFVKMQEERGESIFLLMLQEMMNEMIDPQPGAENGRLANLTLPELLGILTSPDRPRQLKLLIGPEFDNIDQKMASLEGEQGTVLVTERNKAAMKVLKEQLGKGKKNLAVFYGAAHLRDMEKRLAEMGFKPVATRWLVAWDVTGKAGAATKPEGTGTTSQSKRYKV